MTALEMSALHAAAASARDGARSEAGVGDLAADCAARLRARLARPQRSSGDWAIEFPAGRCACDWCDTLRVFLADQSRRTFKWPLAQQGRQHVHTRIDAVELPVTHVTRRQGRPYTLVLDKTDARRCCGCWTTIRASDFSTRLTAQGLELLNVTAEHAEAIRDFPELVRHDPYDRLLVAQASRAGLRLLTADRVLLGLACAFTIDAGQ